jgi:pilus assembly protein CpaF
VPAPSRDLALAAPSCGVSDTLQIADADADAVMALCRHAVGADGDVGTIVSDEARRLHPLRSRADQDQLARRALARLNGLGQLDVLLADPDVDEVLVNARCDIWVDRGGSIRPAGQLTEQRVEHLLERILAPLGRRVDRTSPIVDARLSDGSRVCAVLPPIAVDGAVLSIRRFSDAVRSIDEFTPDAGEVLLGEIIDARCNVVVSGATSSGKTSLVSALLARVAPHERLIVVEDTTELVVAAADFVRLEARPALADGPPPVVLADLVRASLRLRPDRIVVGEVRGDEVLALVQAMNTGHDGSISTCHANGPLDALFRLETLVLQAAPTWPLDAIRHQLQRSIDVIVHVDRDPRTGRRTVAAIAEVVPPDATRTRNSPQVRMLARAVDGVFEQTADLTRRRDRRRNP